MKKVIAYECADGTVKTNKRDALAWDRTLELRGIMQTDMRNSGSMTPTHAANEIIKNFAAIREIMNRYERKIKAAEREEAAKEAADREVLVDVAS